MTRPPRIAVGRISANCKKKKKSNTRFVTDKHEFPRVKMVSSWLSASTREESDVVMVGN